MGKRMVKVLDVPSSDSTAILLILSASFFLGSLAGCLLVNQIGGEGNEVLAGYLDGFLTACRFGITEKPQLCSLAWDILRWPLLIILLGFTPLGLLGIPAVFLIRGFLLSFAVSSFFRAIGISGLGFSFVVFGISGLISIPTLFVLGVQSFLLAGAVTGRIIGESRKTTLIDRTALLRCGMCSAALCVCLFAEYYVIPAVLESFAGSMLG